MLVLGTGFCEACISDQTVPRSLFPVPCNSPVPCSLFYRYITIMAESETPTQLGPYLVLRRLGRGGMAEVFLACYTAKIVNAVPTQDRVVSATLTKKQNDLILVRCWKKEKKALDQRWHTCVCGANCSRDEESGSARTPPMPSSGSGQLGIGYGENAARVMMRALTELFAKTPKTENKTGLESGRAEVGAKTQLCETPSIPIG